MLRLTWKYPSNFHGYSGEKACMHHALFMLSCICVFSAIVITFHCFNFTKYKLHVWCNPLIISTQCPLPNKMDKDITCEFSIASFYMHFAFTTKLDECMCLNAMVCIDGHSIFLCIISGFWHT